MSFVKHQHYVPQFYLKNFADSAERIWVYDKIQDKIFQTRVNNIAGENYFYDAPALDKLTGVKQVVEKLLCTVEGKAAEVLSVLLPKLRSNNFIQLHRDERNFLSIFLVVQMLRTKEYRILQWQRSRLLSNSLRQRFTEDQIVKGFGKGALAALPDEQVAELQARRLLDRDSIRQMAVILNSHIWMLYKAKDGQVFLTSDNPFSKRGYIKHPFRSFSGIRSRGVEIVFPISPGFCLCLAERSYFQRFEQWDGKILELELDDNMVYYNDRQIRNSTRYLFSSQNDFQFVKQVCREDPILKNPLRKRITSNHDTAGDLVTGE